LLFLPNSYLAKQPFAGEILLAVGLELYLIIVHLEKKKLEPYAIQLALLAILDLGLIAIKFVQTTLEMMDYFVG
jgi:hypothetical protein